MKRASILTAVLFSLGVAANAQTTDAGRIPGTQCSIAAPAGFEPSKTFFGFQEAKTGAFIMVNELPAPVKAVTEGFSAAAMRGRGMKLLRTEATTVMNKAATRYTVSQESKGTTFTKFLLVFGEGDMTTLVTAGYPEKSGADTAQLRKLIESIDCDRSKVVDPLEAAPFRLNTEGSEFRPVKFAGGSLLYSTDGKVPTEKPVLIAGRSHGKSAITSRKDFAEKRLLQLPGAEKATVRKSSEITIDGLPGFEVVADGSGKAGNAALVYEVVLFTEDDAYFIILGQANERSDALEETYRRIAKSFRRK